MATPHLLIFDDGRGDFGPLTDLRPAFDLRTGALTTRQRVEFVLGIKPTALRVPEPLRELTAEQNPRLAVNQPLAPGMWLLVNGRLVGGGPIFHTQDWSSHPYVVVDANQDLLCAFLPHDQAQALVDRGFRGIGAGANTQVRPERNLLYARPWHIFDHLEQTLRHDLEHTPQNDVDKISPTVHCLGPHRINVVNARLQPGVVLNAEAGPIEIAPDVVIGAGSVLEGPCFIGEHTVLAAHTFIRPNTVIGPHCKVAGEIAFSIFQGYTNKTHFGFVGHSLVGQWVNLGAGTTVSNLKNTYGSVRVQLRPDQPAQDTGRQFQGPILGDFVRTAIGSRLLTGSCLATGTMLALSGFAPKCSRRLGFYTDERSEGVPHEIEKFLQTIRTMMIRRKETLSPALEKLLRALA